MKDNNKENKTDKKTIILGIIAIIAIILAIIFGLKSCSTDKVAEENTANNGGITWDANAEEGGLTHRSTEEIQEELNKKVEEGMINISMNTSPVFENGTAKGNLMIVNSERNNYPQVVYIVLKETGEEIYRSGAIAVGSKIENAALNVDLDAGTYNCVAYFNNVDVETGNFLGTAGAEIQITVNN